MKRLALLLLIAPLSGEEKILLTPESVKNLRIQTAEAVERDFETTAFAIGRIEEIPARHSSLASRIPGRALEVRAFEGDTIKEGDVLVRLESRQPGNPPPVIELRALQDGLIIESRVHAGQPVEPDAQLMDISDRSEMWAVASIPEQAAAKVKIGAKARVTIPAVSDKPIVATLQRYGVSADRDSGSVEGVFVLPNPEKRLVPGMRAEFSLILDTQKYVLSVPVDAVQGDPANRIVYAKDFELANSFIKCPVTLGRSNDQYVEVLSGLFEGDEIVTNGSYSLGFVGNASGMSLKEALDSAHGHKHNEDGSEMEPGHTEEADQGREAPDAHGEEAAWITRSLPYYAGAVTLLALILIQILLKRKKC